MSRAVALIDMDCFYVQVEQRDNAAFWGKPCAVLQGSGLLIAVSYEARDLGVTRGHRVKEARMICPEIHLFNVPEPRGKADLTKYRDAGAEVITVLSHFERCLVERASIDEAYVDMTQEVNARLVAMETCSITADQLPNTFVVGWEVEDDGKTGINPASIDTWLRTMDESDRRLAVAAIVTEEMRAAILRDCGFHCSAGIAHNKLLAKLVCSRHKPNKQTVLPLAAVNTLFMTTPVQKIRLLGGKLGCEVTQQLGVEFVAELCQFSEKQLQLEFGEKQGSWLYQVCRGVDNEPVRPRRLAKSIGCGKNFPGIEQLDTEEKVHHWLRMMSLELEERLIRDKHENKRQARLLTVHVRMEGKSHSVDASRSCPILRYEADKICSDSLLLLRKFQQPRDSLCSHHTWTPAILNLSMSASKFDDLQSNSSSIKQFVLKTQSSPMCAGSSASMVRSSDPMCGSCVSIPGSSDLMRRSSASVVRSSDPMHGSSIPIPGSSVSKSGSPGSVVRSSDPMHGSSTSLSGSSDTMHVSADPTHESSDIVSGSLSSMPGSSAQKIGSPSEDNNISFFMAAYTLKTCQPADRCPLYSRVQTLPDTHRHTDPEDVMSSCHSSIVSHLQLHHSDDCHLGHHCNDHHCNDHCSGQCNTANETDSSSLGQTQSLTGICEDKPAENCEYECGDMLRTDKDVIDANDIIREDQETDTVIGRSELESAATCAAASENGTVESRCISDTSADMTQCHKCGVTIEVWKILEHSDFHLAVELQEQETVTSNSKRKSTDSGSHTKKRRNSVRNATTLHRFFEAS